MLQLFDLAGIYYRAFYALPSSIRSDRGEPVNAIRGSVEMIARVIEEARPSRAVACLDLDWRPAWRVELVPSYKTHRLAPSPGSDGSSEDVPDDLATQVPILLELLAAVGIVTAGAPECEADDVIATLCHREQHDPVEVVTGDRDLFQVIRAAPTPVTIRYIGGGMSKMRVFDETALRDEYGVDGPGYAAMATLRGDPSDGLPGVAGIGAKTAARLVAEHSSVAGVLAAAADSGCSMSPSIRAKLLAAGNSVEAAATVVRARVDAEIEWNPSGAEGQLPPLPADSARLDELADRYAVTGAVTRLCRALWP